ncbi:MAG: 2-isopropylmalate synthase [Treponema sp.]|nr:2-isopropylmalate synthase [Treponema sp.]
MKINGKYSATQPLPMENRLWPSKKITKAPVWCSVDLRDGNQALKDPMGIESKLEYFSMLVRLGFKEIEVGFPSSSDTEYEFVRRLIEEKRIPDDVWIQVLSQAKDSLIKKTLEAVKGAKHVIFHIYNATSPAQRLYNFNKSKEEILALAVDGVRALKKHMHLVQAAGTQLRFEYSPENFSQTEIEYAIQICEAVSDEWGASADNKIILNLPTTVEASMPNHFADMIEYFCSHIKNRENCIISIHNHNDRGESIAQCELGMLAGAERVEGCLFGNGERTGNLDIVTVALNMYSQGVDPELDFSNIPVIAERYSHFTGMAIPPRAPYAGELVFTAFSGSHQDAIRKAIKARNKMPENALWDVPYLLIDPHDIGREYEGIIRINSQSGKGGAAYILESDYGIVLPKAMQPVVGSIIKHAADKKQRELESSEIYDIFIERWVNTKSPLNVLDITEKHIEGERGSDLPEQVATIATVEWEGKRFAIAAKGNGPLDAFVSAMKQTPAPKFNITSFHEHSIGTGSDTHALAYVQITKDDGQQVWGVGKSSNVGRAGIAAVVSALNFRKD